MPMPAESRHDGQNGQNIAAPLNRCVVTIRVPSPLSARSALSNETYETLPPLAKKPDP